MARPKSDAKRQAIMAAAIQVFAENGLSATPTSAISKSAGVAEGTLFTDFSTKNALINALYRSFKVELAELLMSEFPREQDVRSKLQHLWDAYVNWGVAHPQKLKVMMLLRVSEALTAESKAIGYEPFAEVEQMARDSIAQRVLRDQPVEFFAAVMGNLAETTVAFMVNDAKAADTYRQAGFEMLWRGVAY